MVRESESIDSILEDLVYILPHSENMRRDIIKMNDLDYLMRKICEFIVVNYHYYEAWIALLDDFHHLVTFSEFGCGEEIKPLIKKLEECDFVSCVSTALMTEEGFVVKDSHYKCTNCPLSTIRRRKIGRVVRLQNSEKVYGLIGVAIQREFNESEEEKLLLKKICKAITVAFDIMQQKENKEDLLKLTQQSKEFCSLLLTGSSNPIIVSNADTCIRYVNKAFEELTGFRAKDVVGHSFPYPWWPDEDVPAIMEHYHKDRRSVLTSTELSLRKKNGSRFWVNTSVKPIKSHRGIRYFVHEWVDITEQKHLRENVEFYVSQLTKAQESERKRIVMELHDETVQRIARIGMEINSIGLTYKELPCELREELVGISDAVKDTLEEIRRIIYQLRPSILDHFGLVPALKKLMGEIGKENGIECVINIEGSVYQLPSDTEIQLFRIVQESLNNVIKHSSADKVIAKITYGEDTLSLNICDDGTGFCAPKFLSNLARENRFGLMGIQERCRLLSGDFSLISKPGHGTSISVYIPIKPHEALECVIDKTSSDN